jgi:hypothetical protein
MLNVVPHPRRADLRAFGLVVITGGILLLGAVLGRIGGPVPAWLAIGVAVAAAGVSILRPEWLRPLQAAWSEAVTFYARAAAYLVKAVCFHLLIGAVRLTGQTLVLGAPGHAGSAWTTRPASAGVPASVRLPGPSGFRLGVRWAWAANQLWTVVLMLFLGLLAWLEPEASRDVPTSNYTLY